MRTHLSGALLSLIMVLGLTAGVRAIGPVTSLTIAPTAATVQAGTAQPFTVVGHDASGTTVDLSANAVLVSTDPTGSVAANRYTAGRAGTWRITASYNNLTATAAVTVTPGPVVDLTVNPNSDPEYVPNGASRVFTAEAFDAFDNKVSGGTVQWRVEGGIGTIVGTAERTARFTPTREGTGRVVALSGTTMDSVEVRVTKAATANVNAVITGPNTNAPGTTGTDAAAGNNANVSDVNASIQPAEPAAESTSCRPWPKPAWIWLFLGYLVLLVFSLYPIRTSRPVWWWIGPLILTIAALWVYFQYRCYPVYPALPYLILLTAIGATSWYNWQRSSPQPKP
ncbi:MAG: hypothetical protein HY421_01150 [Candidatus Kerfeldbacteria bacterium]|nr:hypothetical protein [Candidatus Kerfeldbacteria bacterium]